MSYTTIYANANDEHFQQRLMAAAAQEGHENPEYAMSVLLRWKVASATDIEQAYEYAINSGNPDPGGDPTVITDAQILAKVQPILNPPPPEPPPSGGNELPEAETAAAPKGKGKS
jgi:hypothetical protein